MDNNKPTMPGREIVKIEAEELDIKTSDGNKAEVVTIEEISAIGSSDMGITEEGRQVVIEKSEPVPMTGGPKVTETPENKSKELYFDKFKGTVRQIKMEFKRGSVEVFVPLKDLTFKMADALSECGLIVEDYYSSRYDEYGYLIYSSLADNRIDMSEIEGEKDIIVDLTLLAEDILS